MVADQYWARREVRVAAILPARVSAHYLIWVRRDGIKGGLGGIPAGYGPGFRAV